VTLPDSIRWRHALRESGLSPTAKSVGQHLANYMNNTTGYAWPSVDTLAGDSGWHRRTVQHALDELEAKGYMTRLKGGGRRHTTRYFMGFPDGKGDTAPLFLETVAESPVNGGAESLNGGAVPPELRELERELPRPPKIFCLECHTTEGVRLYDRGARQTEAYCDEHAVGALYVIEEKSA
jgi:Helix-turn-helix domain